MKTIEYIAEVLPDGHLSIPKDILKKLRLRVSAKLRVLIILEEKPRSSLSRFCGQWQDDRDAEEIVSEIYDSRRANTRSERVKL